MLERLNVYVENQEFCMDPMPIWPPLPDGQVFVGKEGISCIETCSSKSKHILFLFKEASSGRDHS